MTPSPRKSPHRKAKETPVSRSNPSLNPEELEAIEAKLRNMPPQAGLFLVFTGTVGGLCIPGLPGLAISLIGSMMVAPDVEWFRNTDSWLKKNAPVVRAEGLRFVDRFFTDLDRRFPKKSHEKTHNSLNRS